MHVTIVLNTDEREDALALARLFGGNGAPVALPAAVTSVPAPPPPVMPAEHPLADVTPSEAVLRAEADRVAGRPTGAPSGGAASPSSDSTGLPWDDRIHSTPPTQTDKGVWRKRRGVTDETFATVSAELRGGSSAAGNDAVAPAAPPVVPTTAPDASPPTPAPADTASGQVVVVAAPELAAPPPPPVETPAAPPPPAAETPAAPPPPPPAADGARFASYPAFVTAMNGRPGAVYAALNTHAQSLGVAGFTALKDQPGLWDVFYDSWPEA